MWKYFLNNPAGRKVGDCAVRAVSVALNISWESAYNLIADAGFNVPSNLNSPNDIIQHLMNSGRVSQQKYEQARQMAAKFRR